MKLMNTGDHHLLHQSCIPIFSVFPKQIKNDKKKIAHSFHKTKR